MNDLIRPALYSAYHHVLPLKQQEGEGEEIFDIVGRLIS
jgi:diaminopimelate decarboxylase